MRKHVFRHYEKYILIPVLEYTLQHCTSGTACTYTVILRRIYLHVSNLTETCAHYNYIIHYNYVVIASGHNGIIYYMECLYRQQCTIFLFDHHCTIEWGDSSLYNKRTTIKSIINYETRGVQNIMYNAYCTYNIIPNN